MEHFVALHPLAISIAAVAASLLFLAGAAALRTAKTRRLKSAQETASWPKPAATVSSPPPPSREENTTSKTYKVFVSGTTKDFGSERLAVREKLESLGFTVIEQKHLEQNGIDPLLDTLKSLVSGSDAVISLIGPHSGFVPDGRHSAYYDRFLMGLTKPSFTQWEILFAKAHGRPIGVITQQRLFESDQDADPCQRAFIAYVKTNVDGLRYYYTHPSQIVGMAEGLVADFHKQYLARQTRLPIPVSRHLNRLRAFALQRIREMTKEGIGDIKTIGKHLAWRTVRDPNGSPDLTLPTAIGTSASIHGSSPEKKPFDRMLVLAEAGDGKSTMVQWALAELADDATVASTMFVPIFANCVTLASCMTNDPSDDKAAILSWLKLAVAPSDDGAGSGRTDPSHVDDFLTAIRSSNYKLLILIDGLDELEPAGLRADPAQARQQPRAARLCHAFDAWQALIGIDVEYFATSRKSTQTIDHDEYVRAGNVIGLRPFELQPVCQQAVRELATKRMTRETGPDDALVDKFVQIFEGPWMRSKLVYFEPLVHFFKEHPDRARQLTDLSIPELMKAEITRVLSLLRDDLLRRGHSGGPSADLDAKILHVLLDVALMSLTPFDTGLPMSVSRRRLEDRLSVTSLPGLSEFLKPSVIVERLLHILVYVSRDTRDPTNALYRLPHNEYRDYLLADGIVRWIDGEGVLIEKTGDGFVADLACTYRGAERISQFVKSIVAEKVQGGDGWGEQFAQKVVERMNSGLLNRTPPERTMASPHGAMLSLLMSLGLPLAETVKIEAAGRCFQFAAIPLRPCGRTPLPLAHNARGANFTEADLRACDLSGLDLTMACFDNAALNGASLARSILTGANLRNVAMGGFKRKRTDLFALPTDLTGACLDNSDWFNYRFSDVKGFFHFWDMEPAPGSDIEHCLVLVSGSRGYLLAFDMSKPNMPPAVVATTHQNEVMDLSRHPAGQTIISSSRDVEKPVGLFEVLNSTSHDTVILRERPLCQRKRLFEPFELNGYPRRSQFSTCGTWFAVIARDPRVFFFKVETDGMVGPPVPGYGHTGPVMCVVSDPAKPGDGGAAHVADTYITAGYDGRVAIWREDVHDKVTSGWSQPRMISDVKMTQNRATEIFRALASTASPCGVWAGTELESRLFLFRFDSIRVWEERVKVFDGDGGVFALALHRSPSRLAVGFASGRVKVFEAPPNSPDHYDWDRPLIDVATSGDIVRSLLFRNEGDLIVVATWDACLLEFDLATGRKVAHYEFPAEGWVPEADAGQIAFNPQDGTLDHVNGLSDRMKRYLITVNS